MSRCEVSLHIFYEYSKNIRRYYTPKHLIRHIYCRIPTIVRWLSANNWPDLYRADKSTKFGTELPYSVLNNFRTGDRQNLFSFAGTEGKLKITKIDIAWLPSRNGKMRFSAKESMKPYQNYFKFNKNKSNSFEATFSLYL